MAGVSVEGAKGRRKSLDSEINMIPMIDLLMVTISFLLITAVWVNASRMQANANVPGSAVTPKCEGDECKEEAKLHIQTSDPSKFTLAWKNGGVVVRSVDVPRESNKSKGGVTYPALAKKIADEWKASGLHRDATDKNFDRAVVHTPNDMSYGDLVAVMDAVAQQKRPVANGSKTEQASAFAVTFAVD